MAFLAYPAMHHFFVCMHPQPIQQLSVCLIDIPRKVEHETSNVLDRPLNLGSVHMQTHNGRGTNTDACTPYVPLDDEQWVCISLFRYFACFLGAARIPDIPVSGWDSWMGRKLLKCCSYCQFPDGQGFIYLIPFLNSVCLSVPTYRVIWHRGVAQQGAVKTAKTVSEAMTPHDCVTAENVIREEGKRRKRGDRLVLQRDAHTNGQKWTHFNLQQCWLCQLLLQCKYVQLHIQVALLCL